MKKVRISKWKCTRCGNEDMFLISQDGEILHLKEGMELYLPGEVGFETGYRQEIGKPDYEQNSDEFEAWAPSFSLGDRSLMCIFGVMVPKGFFDSQIRPEDYSTAYLSKIKGLIEKWNGEPLPVLFDKYFTAPYIGAGEPSQVLLQMWQELEEIRRPVIEIDLILKKGEVLRPLKEPLREELQKLLEGLTLETFLECVSKFSQGQ